jgi:hypothetical protein
VQKNGRFLDVTAGDTSSNHLPPSIATSAYNNKKIRERKRTCNTILAGFQLLSKSTKTYKLTVTLLPCLVLWELHATSTFRSQKTSRYNLKVNTVTMFVIFTTHVSCIHVYSCWQCLAVSTYFPISIHDRSRNWKINTNSEYAMFSKFLFYIQHLSSFKVLQHKVPI